MDPEAAIVDRRRRRVCNLHRDCLAGYSTIAVGDLQRHLVAAVVGAGAVRRHGSPDDRTRR